MSYRNINEKNREDWLKKTISALPPGIRILDARAAELRNRDHCVANKK
jgi:hypothetical protein